MKFGSLFAGIGGFDLGLERSGMTCQWQVEIEDYPTKILEKHWPEVHRERDIKECSGKNLEPVDLICGGFPCQDISVAGTGAGLAGERSGLWYEMHRIIGDIKPRWVVVENVAALLFRGMDVVLRDLSQIGYDCEWHVISASAVGAPHRRERVWIIASANSVGRVQERKRKSGKGSSARTEIQLQEKRTGKEKAQGEFSNAIGFNDAVRRNRAADAAAMAGRDGNAGRGKRNSRKRRKESTGQGSCNVSNANGVGLERQRVKGHSSGRKVTNGSPGLCNREELRRHANWWEAEPGMGRVAHGISRRMDRLKGLGNAVVPQIVELIGRRIMEIEGNA